MAAPKKTIIEKQVEFQSAVAQAVADLREQEIKASTITPKRCLSCWKWSQAYSANQVCIGCGTLGRGIDYNYCLARRIGLAPGNSIPDLDIEIARLATRKRGEATGIEDLLREDFFTDADIQHLYDTWRHETRMGLPRMPSPSEKALAEKVQQEQQARDKLRSLKSQKTSIELQLTALNTRLDGIITDIADLEGGSNG